MDGNIIFLNTRGTEGEESPDMDELFSYINGGAGSIGAEGCGELVRLVDGYVRLYNTDGSWRKEYMKLDSCSGTGTRTASRLDSRRSKPLGFHKGSPRA